MNLDEAALAFVTERHLAVLATLRPDGTPHAVPVGFTWDDDAGIARVITSRGSRKVANLLANHRCALTQVDGRRWLSLEGHGTVLAAAAAVADAERRYEVRYRAPRPNRERVVIEIRVDRVLGNL